MAQQLLQRHFAVLVLSSSLLLCYFACQEVVGIAMYPQAVEEVDNRDRSPVDGNNLLKTEDGTMIEMFPHPDAIHFQLWNKTDSNRRKLGDFLGCAYCKCCNADQSYCQSALPCCYSITCDTYPFGFCKFVPVSCNCHGCGI